MATVYVATDLRLERRIALKVMHGHLSDDTVFQSRFIQEARAAARLADPHVVNVFDQGQDGDMAYLVMEYLPGITLRELLREQRRLTIPQTITIMDAVLAGLAAAHRAGIVHRDVKPENILLADDGRIKIGDFGLARATSANTAAGAQLLGTIAYLAPELVTRGTADARSDIYSLGIMLYEMLTGEQPYKGEQPMQIAFQHANDSVPRPSVRNPGVPEQLDELVLWSTEKNPDDRPVDARAMLDRFREIERELGIQPQVARAVPIGVVHDEGGAQTELTKVLPSAAVTGPMATIDDVDNAAQLRVMTKRRARRGGWLIALVILLAALAAAGRLVVRHRTRLDGDGAGCLAEDFRGGAGDAAGGRPDGRPEGRLRLRRPRRDDGRLRARRRPAGRQGLHRDGPGLQGPAGPCRSRPSAACRPIRRARRSKRRCVQVGDDLLFFTDAAENSVTAASVTPRSGEPAIDCTPGCTLHEGDSAVLSVSVGPVPDVTGKSVGDATAALNAKGLQIAGTYEETSESIDEGLVIRMDQKDGGGAWQPNDAVTLVISSGPPLFPVPNIVGMTRDQAKAALDEAGFRYDYNSSWDLFPDPVTQVEAQDPAADSKHTKGSVVTFRIKAAL